MILGVGLFCSSGKAQTPVQPCIPSVNSQGVVGCSPISATNPLPVTGGTSPGGSVYTKPAQLTPLGYVQYSLTTAATLGTIAGGSIPTGAVYAYVTTEVNAFRYRDDGVAPTASVGFPVVIGSVLVLQETNLASVQLVSQSGTATLDVGFYK